MGNGYERAVASFRAALQVPGTEVAAPGGVPDAAGSAGGLVSGVWLSGRVNETRGVQGEGERSALLDRARALAMVDAACETRYEMEEWGGWGGYTLTGPEEGHPCRVLTSDDGFRGLDVHFHPEGMFVMGWDRDEGALVPPSHLWRLVVEQVPEALRSCIRGNPARDWVNWTEPESDADDDDQDDWVPYTFALWRSAGEPSWHVLDTPADFEFPERNEKREPVELERLPPWSLLADLVSPSPDQLTHGSETVRDKECDEVPWRKTGMTRPEAVRHVIALRPLTEQVVRTLNPFIGLDDLRMDIAAIGYPQDGSGARQSFEGSGSPVIVGRDDTVEFSGFALEATPDGLHRIFVRHTGMAWEVTGEGADARIVQAEAHEGNSQRFTIQLVTDDGGYEPADTWVRYSHYRILTADARLALEAPLAGGPLFLAGPDDGPGQRFEAESAYLSVNEPPLRHYQTLHSIAGRVHIPDPPPAERQ
ncbi:RICIN domain-containing protein [Streptomyces sp. NPDC088729]|uniref:RICIN domain-containing protein n=1 Tax=Streptomyces sp. NPDC088729 TaxID=3365876 RepID=UPI0037FA10FF